MKNKSGVTLIVIMVSILVMFTIISSASVIDFESITTANFEEYKSSISRVADNVNSYFLDNNVLPVTNEIVSGSSLGDNFYNNLIKNADENNNLFVVDVSLLNNYSIKKGRGTLIDKDIYLVAANTNNVYYLSGFKYKGITYFTN